MEVLSAWGLSVLLASVILAGAALSVAPIRLPQGRQVIALGGFVSGVAGTTTGVGGPPLALTLQHIPPRQLRGTMSVYFLVGASISLAVLAAWGQFGTRHLLGVALLVPGQLLGYLVSGRLVRVLDRGYTRPALLIISVAAATEPAGACPDLSCSAAGRGSSDALADLGWGAPNGSRPPTGRRRSRGAVC